MQKLRSRPPKASITHRRDPRGYTANLAMKNCSWKAIQSDLGFKVLLLFRRELSLSKKQSEYSWNASSFVRKQVAKAKNSPKIVLYDRTRSVSQHLYALLLMSGDRFQSRLRSLINLWCMSPCMGETYLISACFIWVKAELNSFSRAKEWKPADSGHRLHIKT